MGKKTVQQREQELAQKIMNDVNAGMDERFARFEQLMERFAAPTETQPPVVQHVPVKAVTRSDKRKADNQQETDAPAQKVSKPAPKRANQPQKQTFHTAFNDHDDCTLAGTEQTLRDAPRHSTQATPRHPSNRFAETGPGCSARAPLVVDQQTDHRYNDPRPSAPPSTSGINDAWAAWSTAHERLPPYVNNTRLPTSTQELQYNDTVDSRVQQLLANTVHNLGKGNQQPYDFPYKYILRGPEKVKALINSVTLPEHLWGIFRILHDPKTNQDIKPCLMVHIEQIVEDAREYEWEAGVRRWSEEVFSRISEGRLVSGWHSTDEIQRMRMILAQSKPIQAAQVQHNQRDNYVRKVPSQTQQQSEILKGGPPCPDYNSTSGCTLKSGHIKNGKRLIHVCSFCLLNTSATNTHPEAYCRNKIRLTGGMNHFQ